MMKNTIKIIQDLLRLPNAVTYVQIWACPWDVIQQKYQRTGKTHLGPTTLIS